MRTPGGQNRNRRPWGCRRVRGAAVPQPVGMNFKRCLLAPLFGVLLVCSTAVPAGAVVGGTPVDPATVPWFASLGGCGGTLVAPDRILTAAHCVYGQTPDQFAGIEIGGGVRKATRIALHPNWHQRNGTSNFRDDVALI